MSDQPPTPAPDPDAHAEPPVATIAPRRFSFVWLVPVLAILGVGWYFWNQSTRVRGPEISIAFPTADGIEPGAELRHRGVTVGVVRTVELDRELDSVRVTAELAPSASGLAAEGTRFWIVRPEVSLSRVAGLETIFGPRYIGVQPAPEGGARTLAFEGLPSPPRLESPADGDALTLVLRAPRVGPIVPGAPVLFRDLPVGVVRGVRLAEDAASVEVTASIDPAYATLVRTNSRFWLASGVGVDWGLFRGLSVRADSLDALIEGAVAFATPDRPGERVGAGHAFEVEASPEDKWLEWDPPIPLRRGADAGLTRP